LTVIQVELLDRPPVGHQQDGILVQRERRTFERLALGQHGPRDWLAVLGPQHQELIGLIELKQDPIKPDPEIRVDLADRRRIRPVEGTGITIERNQLPSASKTKNAPFHQVKATQYVTWAFTTLRVRTRTRVGTREGVDLGLVLAQWRYVVLPLHSPLPSALIARIVC
jgi:hypothetical protein